MRNIPLAWNVPQGMFNLSFVTACTVRKNTFRKTTFCGTAAPQPGAAAPTAHGFRVELKLFSVPFLSRKGSRRRPPVFGGFMERYRLKNIIILILVLVNAFLLASLSMRKSAEQDAFRRTAEELVELFAADGMTLDAYAISREAPPSGVALVRDPDLEAKAAAFLLGGSPAYADSGGGIYQYRTDAGTVLFRSSGGFEAAGTFGAGRGEDFCREFCRTFSFSEPLFQYEENSGLNGIASAVFQLYRHLHPGRRRRHRRQRCAPPPGQLIRRPRPQRCGTPQRRRGPRRLPANAPGTGGRRLRRRGHQSLLRAPERRLPPLPGSRLADCHRYGKLLCKLLHRRCHGGLRADRSGPPFSFTILSHLFQKYSWKGLHYLAPCGMISLHGCVFIFSRPGPRFKSPDRGYDLTRSG